jgi:hypothetical protein
MNCPLQIQYLSKETDKTAPCNGANIYSLLDELSYLSVQIKNYLLVHQSEKSDCSNKNFDHFCCQKEAKRLFRKLIGELYSYCYNKKHCNWQGSLEGIDYTESDRCENCKYYCSKVESCIRRDFNKKDYGGNSCVDFSFGKVEKFCICNFYERQAKGGE